MFKTFFSHVFVRIFNSNYYNPSVAQLALIKLGIYCIRNMPGSEMVCMFQQKKIEYNNDDTTVSVFIRHFWSRIYRLPSSH